MGDFAIVHARTTYTLQDGRAGSGRYTDVWAKRERPLARGLGARDEELILGLRSTVYSLRSTVDGRRSTVTVHGRRLRFSTSKLHRAAHVGLGTPDRTRLAERGSGHVCPMDQL